MINEDEYIKDINEIISRRKNDLSLIKSVDDLSNIEYLDMLIEDVLLDEFVDFGLKEDSEPNEYGFMIEKLITFLNEIRYKMT